MAKKLDYNYCKAAYILEWMGNKSIPQVSEKMLVSTLKQLEHDGLVSRTVYKEQPPHVEYSLTPLGESFLREISYVMEWGQIHHNEVMQNREKNMSVPVCVF